MQLRGNEDQILKPHLQKAFDQGVVVGARSAALSVLEKIEKCKKPNPKKVDLQTSITEVTRFCREIFNLELPRETSKEA